MLDGVRAVKMRTKRLSFPIGALLTALGLPFAAEAAVSPAPESLFTAFGLPITNSMVTSWVVVVLLIVGVRAMVGSQPKLIPGRGQAIVENFAVGLKNLIEPIVGKKATPATLPFVIGFFIYIVIQNWAGLLPGVGTIGLGYHDADGYFHVTRPWIRPANADWNGTIALAVIAMGAWLYIVLRYAGFKALVVDLFGNKADKNEVGATMWMMLIPLFLFVGVIEVVSIAIRPLTLSVRLFGNIFGGENLLHGMYFIPPFYFLELLVGLVQALVFVLLFSVYIGLICNHGDEHEHAEQH